MSHNTNNRESSREQHILADHEKNPSIIRLRQAKNSIPTPHHSASMTPSNQSMTPHSRQPTANCCACPANAITYSSNSYKNKASVGLPSTEGKKRNETLFVSLPLPLHHSHCHFPISPCSEKARQRNHIQSFQATMLGLRWRVTAILVYTQHGQGIQMGATIDVGFRS